jgi:hypothetical protein
MQQKTERIAEAIDRPKAIPKFHKPNKHEVEHLITQAYEALVNFPDSVAAKRRYEGLVAYRKENF